MGTPSSTESRRVVVAFVVMSTAASAFILGAFDHDGMQTPSSEGLLPDEVIGIADGVSGKDATPTVQGVLDFDPDVLNLRSGGKYVTAYLELPEGYSVLEVFVPSVKLNGAVYAETCFGVQVFDTDADGERELMLKFAKSDVKAALAPGESVEVRVTGVMNDGTPFSASDVITVTGP
jgi:hypothetical protein